MTLVKGANAVRYQAGLKVQNKGERKASYPMMPLRAIVLNTYGTDDTENNPLGKQVLCDVLLIKSMLSIDRVPVVSQIGVVNGAPWTPKPTTATLSGQPLNLQIYTRRGQFQGNATPFDDMNGDIVLVQFIDVAFPVITGPLPHDATKRLTKKGSGWVDATVDAQRGLPETRERYLRHGGTEIRINEKGDVLLDTTGATDEELTETPSADTGDVQLRLKLGRAVVIKSGVAPNAQLLRVTQDPVTLLPKVQLGNGLEPIILGTTYTQPELAMINAIEAWMVAATPLAEPIPGPLAPLLVAAQTAIAAFKAAVPLALSKVSSTD